MDGYGVPISYLSTNGFLLANESFNDEDFSSFLSERTAFSDSDDAVTGNGSSLNTTSVDPFAWLPEKYRKNLSYAETRRQCDIYQQYISFRVMVDVFVLAPMCLFGLIGNALAIKVLRTDNVNNKVSFLLQALAVADNSVLVTSIFLQTMRAVMEGTNWFPALLYTFPYFEPYLWPCASIAHTATVWLVVLITWDRYLAICRPFDEARFSSPTKAKRAVLAVVLAAVIYNLPRFFEQVVLEQPDYCLEVIRPVSKHSRLRQSQVYFIMYKTVLYLIFRVFLPLGTLAIFNTKLIIALRAVKRNHAVLTKTSPNNKKDYFTVILVGMVTVFLVCETPDFLLRTTLTIMHFTVQNKTLALRINISYCNTISNMLLTLNSSINCVVYCLVGKRFRKILVRLFCKSCEAPRQPNTRSQQSFASSKYALKETFV